MEKEIEKIIKILKTKGWDSPEAVDEFFEVSLIKIANFKNKQCKEKLREVIESCPEEPGYFVEAPVGPGKWEYIRAHKIIYRKD